MNNLVRVSLGGARTDYFIALNGVEQGAVVSPILYCGYVDDLLLKLSRAGVSCFIGLHFVGALAYADDLVQKIMPANIASPSMHLNLVTLPKNYRITFKKFHDCIFYIDGRMIDLVQSFSHLGHLITSDSNDCEDNTIRKHSFIGQVNNTLCYFGKLSSFVKYNIFHAHCNI